MAVPDKSARDGQLLLGQLPADVAQAGPAWLCGLRADAAGRLQKTGFPTRKDEGWRFTSLDRVVTVPFERSTGDAADAASFARAHLGDDGTVVIPFVDGRPALALADELPDGIDVWCLEDALAAETSSIETHLGKIARAEFFGALNAALFEDVIVLRLRSGAQVEQTVQIVHVAVPGAGPTAAYPRVLILAEPASEARVVETYLAREGQPQLTNAVTEVWMGQDARLDHTRVTEGTSDGLHLGQLAVRQDRGSAYASRVVSLGGRLTRLDLTVGLEGEGADCVLDGVYHVGGEQHTDHQTLITHAAPRCTSNERYRGILDGRGRAVFNGIIVVDRDAQQTNAHQENRNLLLSDEAVINTKPHLEIDADDVKCSHGATIGALDDAQLFFLRSRGIPEDQARDMLTFAFVEALLERIPHGAVASRLGRALVERLPHSEQVREMVS